MTEKPHRTLAHPLNPLAARVHKANEKWWVDLKTGERLKRNLGELMMLTISELAEAMEGHRKSLPDDKLPHRSMFEVELADAYIRVLDVAGGYGVNLDMWAVNARLVTWSDNVAENLLILCNVAHRVYQYGRQTIVPIDITELLINIESLSLYYQVDLMGAFEEKMTYNAQRVDHTHAHRLQEGGKKY